MVLNAAHIHLLLNHVPILGFAFGLLLLVWGWYRGSDEVVRAALGLFLLVGLASVLVFFSGGGAEEVVEDLAGVSHDAIEAHEETGELAMLVSVVMGVLSGAGFFVFRVRSVPGWLKVAALAGGAIAFGLLSYAGFQGGQIHHEEVRPQGAAVAQATRIAIRAPGSSHLPEGLSTGA